MRLVPYDLAVETSRELGGEPSMNRAETRGTAADLRYTGGYLLQIFRRSGRGLLLRCPGMRQGRVFGGRWLG
jgi:hypothetical protein